jgi:hypothetical protein
MITSEITFKLHRWIKSKHPDLPSRKLGMIGLLFVATGDTSSKPTNRSLTTSKQTNPGADFINKLFTAPLLRFESPQEARPGTHPFRILHCPAM